jgi:hypothetical protein
MWKWIRDTLLMSGLTAIVGGVLGFLISEGLHLYEFSESQKQTNRIEQIHLLRDLTLQFRGNNAQPFYQGVEVGIDRCERLYKGGDLGRPFKADPKALYGYDTINNYLGFFDDVGFYESQSAISLTMVNQAFGAIIIEAYEYPELRRYVEVSRTRDPNAFIYFLMVAQKLEQLPEDQQIVENARNAIEKCQSHG